jgi:L-asparagine transporter-like permease
MFAWSSVNISFAILLSIAAPMKKVFGFSLTASNAFLILRIALFAVFHGRLRQQDDSSWHTTRTKLSVSDVSLT